MGDSAKLSTCTAISIADLWVGVSLRISVIVSLCVIFLTSLYRRFPLWWPRLHTPDHHRRCAGPSCAESSCLEGERELMMSWWCLLQHKQKVIESDGSWEQGFVPTVITQILMATTIFGRYKTLVFRIEGWNRTEKREVLRIRLCFPLFLHFLPFFLQHIMSVSTLTRRRAVSFSYFILLNRSVESTSFIGYEEG